MLAVVNKSIFLLDELFAQNFPSSSAAIAEEYLQNNCCQPSRKTD
jgi:hypothetical protein